MSFFFLPIIIASVFYFLLPLTGAFSVRRGWRSFRKQISDAWLCRELSYSDPGRSRDGFAGNYRFIGDLQAIQNESSVWLNNGSISVKAELEDVKIYLLPTFRTMETEDRIEKNEDLLPQEMPKKLNWERVYSLAQGTGFLLSGAVYLDNGNPVFCQTPEHPLLVIIYDGKRDTILRRSVWCGRQLNEYWNALTPPSLLAGSFSLFVLAYVFFRRPDMRMFSIFILLLSMVPVMPILPPGLFFYSVYKRLWKSGRLLRGERDLLRLPLRFFCNGEKSGCLIKKCGTTREALDLFPKAKVRSCAVIPDAALMSSECTVFLSENETDKKKSDPLFENLIIPGDPESLSAACRRRARLMEVLAITSFGFAIIINSVIIYFILIWFL
ncbi:MAG: hypothetical protein JEZ04_14600 [Spirochaetales bacterium]|nr:hypothetical protein [Spirochaetales bacterium]